MSTISAHDVNRVVGGVRNNTPDSIRMPFVRGWSNEAGSRSDDPSYAKNYAAMKLLNNNRGTRGNTPVSGRRSPALLGAPGAGGAIHGSRNNSVMHLDDIFVNTSRANSSSTLNSLHAAPPHGGGEYQKSKSCSSYSAMRNEPPPLVSSQPNCELNSEPLFCQVPFPKHVVLST